MRRRRDELHRQRIPGRVGWCVGVLLLAAILLWGFARYIDAVVAAAVDAYIAAAHFDEVPLSRILQEARSGADTRRAAYVAFLGHVFRDDLPPLRRSDFSTRVRRRAPESLRAAAVLPALLAALEDPVPLVRRAAISVLTELDEHASSACAALRRRLLDADADVRLDAAVALIAIEGDDRGPLAIAVGELLDPDSPSVRAAAARKLGELADPRGVPFLEAAQADADDTVRAAATAALRALDRLA